MNLRPLGYEFGNLRLRIHFAVRIAGLRKVQEVLEMVIKPKVPAVVSSLGYSLAGFLEFLVIELTEHAVKLSPP